MKLCILANSYVRHKLHNYLLFTNASLQVGCEPHLATIDTMGVRNGAVFARCLRVESPLVPGTELSPDAFTYRDLGSFDVVWVVGFGNYATRTLKLQMLWMLGRKLRIVNSVESLQYLHNKFHLNLWPEVFRSPETYLSSDFTYLWEVFSRSDCDWVVKPPAGSFGRDVFLVRRGDSNAKVLLQHFTGNGEGELCLLQRYVPEIRNGEKRVLLAEGGLVCVYRKDIVVDWDHRTNVRQGGESSVCELSADETELCVRISRFFADRGAGWIGIDLVYPHVIEINIVNPGGLINFERLTGENRAPVVVSRVLKR